MGSPRAAAAAETRGGRLNLVEQIVNSALRYRGQAPLVDALLKEIGLTGRDVNGLTRALNALSGSTAVEASPTAGEAHSVASVKE